MGELAEQLAQLGLLGMELGDALAGEPVEDPELLLAQALVGDEIEQRVGDAAGLADQPGGGFGPAIGRGQHHVGPLGRRHLGEPPSDRRGLALAERAQRHVDVAPGDVDMGVPRRLRGVPGDVAGALAVPHDPDPVRPALLHCSPRVSGRVS